MTTPIDSQIRAILDSAVTQISGLLKQATVEQAVAALKKGLPHSTATTGVRMSARPAKVSVASSPSGKGSSPKGTPTSRAARSRRSPAQIARTVAQALAYVKAHPDTRSEHLRKDLSLTPIQTADALGRLLADKKIKSKGEKRATTYSAV